jgi:hypothetical protein
VEFEHLNRLRVLVIGDAMVDVYLHGPVSRLCREGPVPVGALRQRVGAPGGAANTSANVRALEPSPPAPASRPSPPAPLPRAGEGCPKDGVRVGQG